MLLLKETLRPAPFGECLVSVLGLKERLLDQLLVPHNGVALHQQEPDSFVLGHASPGLPLFHHQNCPCKGRSALSSDVVRLAACVVLVDRSSHRVLFTRRSLHLRSFGGVYVLPGGHRDPGETLAQAAARELLEETGVDVAAEALEPLAFYESVFPPENDPAVPVKRQHLVQYFVARVDEPQLKCSADEIDRFCWLTTEQLLHVFGEDSKCSYYDAITVPEGKTIEKLDLVALRGVPVNGKYLTDRISTGSQYVVKYMIQSGLLTSADIKL